MKLIMIALLLVGVFLLGLIYFNTKVPKKDSYAEVQCILDGGQYILMGNEWICDYE